MKSILLLISLVAFPIYCMESERIMLGRFIFVNVSIQQIKDYYKELASKKTNKTEDKKETKGQAAEVIKTLKKKEVVQD